MIWPLRWVLAVSSPTVERLVIAFDASFSADSGGTGRYLREMQRALALREDVDLRVWRTPRVTWLPRALRVPLNLALHLVGTQLLLPRWARRQGADVVWCSMIAPLSRRVPVLLTLHDAIDAQPALRSSRLWSAYMRTLGAASARRAPWVFTGSQAAAREIARAYGVSRARLAVTPYGVRLPLDGAEAAIASRFDGVRYVLLVGGAAPRKRHDVALAAVREVRRSGVNLQLVVVGRTTAAGQREPWVHSLTDVSDAALVGLYRAAVALLLPSVHEGYGFPAVEARACGTAVISADLDAVREQVPDALFVRSWEPTAWAAAIALALHGTGAGQTAGDWQAPTWERTAAQSVAMVRGVVEEGRQIRVLLLHPSDAAYGADRWLMQVLRDQPAEMTSRVVLPSRVPSGPLRQWLAAQRVPHASMRLPVLQRAAVRSVGGALRLLLDAALGVPRLIWRVRRERPDVVVSNTLALGAGALAAWMTGTPHVWHVHEVISDEPALQRWVLRRAVRWLPGRVVANSQATADALRWPTRDRTSGSRLVVIPNGVERFPMREDAAGDVGPLRIAVLGRVSARKGWREAVDALALVVAGGHDVTLDWFGSAPDDDPGAVRGARQYAASLGLAGMVTFHGHVDDAAERLAQFDALLLPSQRPESFSLAVLEGMAAGCAVVAVRCGGGSDALVAHGRTGLLCDPAPESIAAALVTLAAQRERTHAMGACGQERARAYTADTMRQEVYAAWQDAVHQRRGRMGRARLHPSRELVT